MSIAFARFFLSDVIDVKSTGTPQSLLLGTCGGGARTGFYSKLDLCPSHALRPAVALQTPKFDLGAVYGTTEYQKEALKIPGSYLLNFRRVANITDASAFDMQPNPNDVTLFIAGTRNANLDHLSLYMHTRWIYLHNRIARWIAQSNPTEPRPTIFNAARVFVQAIARNILQDFIGPFGPFADKLPIGYNSTIIQADGIPPEFLLVSFFDSFPEKFLHYNETSPNLKIGAQPGVTYRSTVYNTTMIQPEPIWLNVSDDVDAQLMSAVPKLAVIGYNAMYNQALFGGSYLDSLRCGQGAPFANIGEYDIVATAIQRGRDVVYPSCNAYRQAHGLPNITFSEFGGGAFAKSFAALHNYDISTVELSTCLLLDPKLRNQMVASLMTAVLELDDASSLPCSQGSSPQYNFGTTAVGSLSGFAGGATALANLMNSVCKPDMVRMSMRALVTLETVRLNDRGVYLASGWTKSKFYECTTADPFLSASGRFKTKYSHSSFVMEDKSQSTHNCNWRDRIEMNTTGAASYWLSNNPACIALSAPAASNRARQCFDPLESNCLGRGIYNSASQACDCDYGWVTNGVGNLLINGTSVVPAALALACEHWRYPRNDHIPNYFAAVVGGCSATLGSNPPTSSFSVVGSAAADYCTTVNNTRYACKNMIGVGTVAWGGCHSAEKPDLGRAFSPLGRILPPVYPDGISCPSCSVNQSVFTTEFHQRYPVNATSIKHNALWRAVGMLLVRDISSNPSTPTNVNGSRSAIDTTIPAQFQNGATGWIDASPLYGSPSNGQITDPGAAILNGGAATNYFTPATLSPKYADLSQEEKHILTLLATRHNQLYSRMGFFTSNADIVLNSIAGLCARELVLEEWRAITGEFISASKCYFRTLHGEANPAKFNFASHKEAVPIEAGAAKIFHLHHTPQSQAAGCSEDPVVAVSADTPFNRTCVANMAGVNLNTQASITGLTSTQFASINVAQLYGLPAVDSYVTALGKPFDYSNSISPNLLLGLHKSAANYAINFGLIESILAEQSTVRDATTACMRHADYSSGYTGQMSGYMPGGALAIRRVTTLAGLLDELAVPGPGETKVFGNGPSAPRTEIFYNAGACI